MINSTKDLRIVFLGTPTFAVTTLDILVQAGYNIVGVVTATDKLGGRGGKQLIQSDVKQYALAHGLHILQPSNLKHPEFIEALRSLKADLQIVVAFRMLPEVVWNMPPFGTYNLHGSLLPRYRGAAPIHWAVINGDRETGVTTFRLKHEIDTGDIAIQRSMEIFPDDTTGDVHDRMMYIGAEAMLETVIAIEAGTITFSPQREEAVSKAPKIFHEDTLIDFTKPTQQVHDFIRGMSPFPGAYTLLDGLVFKILKAEIAQDFNRKAEPESYHTDGKKNLYFRCSDGWIKCLQVKMAGKKLMEVPEFLNGYVLQ